MKKNLLKCVWSHTRKRDTPTIKCSSCSYQLKMTGLFLNLENMKEPLYTVHAPNSPNGHFIFSRRLVFDFHSLVHIRVRVEFRDVSLISWLQVGKWLIEKNLWL